MLPKVNTQAGVSIVEVIIGASILAAIVVSSGLAMVAYIDSRSVVLSAAKATYLTEEGYELLRAVRDDSWLALAAVPVDTRRYLDVDPTTIAITTTPEVIDSQYTRSFVLWSLYRDSDDDVVASTTPGAAVDPSGRIVVMSVLGPGGTTTLQSILSNVHQE